MKEKQAKASEKPGFCNTAALAGLFDVSDHWIGDLTKAGILRKYDTPAGGRYNIVEATRSYCRYLRERIDNRTTPKIFSGKESAKLAAEVRLKTAKAEYSELELQELANQMHKAEDVEAMTEQLTLMIRKLVSRLPELISAKVVGVGSSSEAAVIIRQECNSVLSELSGFRYSREVLTQLREELHEGRERE